MTVLQRNFEDGLASDVIDTLVQANIDLRSVTLEQAKQLVARAQRARHERNMASARRAPR